MEIKYLKKLENYEDIINFVFLYKNNNLTKGKRYLVEILYPYNSSLA